MIGPVVLTDAELDVLELAHLRREGVRPDDGVGEVQDRPGDEDGTTAPTPAVRREAVRSLTVRGILGADGLIAAEGDLGALLTVLLDVRLTAGLVLSARRVVAPPVPDPERADDDHHAAGDRFVHLLYAGACVEDVLPDGSHHLHLEPDLDLVPERVAEVTVPEDAAAAPDRRPVTLRTDDLHGAAAILGRPTVLARLEALVPPDGGDDPTVLSAHLVALGPRGCWAADLGRPGAGTSTVELRPVAPGWVEGWVRTQTLPAVQGTMSG